MRRMFALAVVLSATILGSISSHAQQLLERYQALLSESDHFNSSGQRLTTAAAIIRQDRANFHRFGIRDPEDESDRFFADADNRALLESLLQRGRAEPTVISRIVNGTPLVQVEVWQGSAGPYVLVTLTSPSRANVEEPQTANPSPPSATEQAPSSSESKIGTAFYVSADGYLITNEHVVNSCSTLKIVDVAGGRIPVRVVIVSKADDLALLKAEVTPLATAVFESARIGQGATVVAYGYPLAGLLASTGNVSTGLVTALSGLDDNPRQMQISAPVQPGNSGGPLVDAKGSVVGVVVAKLNAIAVARVTQDIPENINFAIKATAVLDLLDANSVRYRSEALQRELPVELLTQYIKEYTVKVECN
jgi:S1-C subfamily serine protease